MGMEPSSAATGNAIAHVLTNQQGTGSWPGPIFPPRFGAPKQSMGGKGKTSCLQSPAATEIIFYLFCDQRRQNFQLIRPARFF